MDQRYQRNAIQNPTAKEFKSQTSPALFKSWVNTRHPCHDEDYFEAFALIAILTSVLDNNIAAMTLIHQTVADLARFGFHSMIIDNPSQP